ncbi:hypothetical protein ACUXKL_000164 [Kocuria marina]
MCSAPIRGFHGAGGATFGSDVHFGPASHVRIGRGSLQRQLPQLSELKPLMRFGSFNPDRRAARLAKAADIEALRRIARRRTPKPAFDYVDRGG